jgi:hypothetical protein
MKYTNLVLLAVLFLASCAAPVTVSPTSTLPSLTNTMDANVPPTVTVTPDPALGAIKGNISWFDSATFRKIPIKNVNLQIDGHTGSNPPKYKAGTDLNGNYRFSNVEPVDYGFGIYFNVPIDERLCEGPEFQFDTDLNWLHYATSKGSAVFDIIFSSTDFTVSAGEVVALDFVLKCP